MRWVLVAIVIAAAAGAVWGLRAAVTPAQQPPAHTVYCAYGSNPAVGFLSSCPPGFHQVSR